MSGLSVCLVDFFRGSFCDGRIYMLTQPSLAQSVSDMRRDWLEAKTNATTLKKRIKQVAPANR